MQALDIEVEVRIIQDSSKVVRGIRTVCVPIDRLELSTDPTLLLSILVQHYGRVAFEHAMSHATVGYFSP